MSDKLFIHFGPEDQNDPEELRELFAEILRQATESEEGASPKDPLEEGYDHADAEEEEELLSAAQAELDGDPGEPPSDEEPTQDDEPAEPETVASGKDKAKDWAKKVGEELARTSVVRGGFWVVKKLWELI